MISEQELLSELFRQRNHITFELTDFILPFFREKFGIRLKNREVLIERWVSLLVQSLLEDLENNQPGIISDFVLVLREREGSFFEPFIWQMALDWLNFRCQNILNSTFDQSQFISYKYEECWNKESVVYLYSKNRDQLQLLLDRLDHFFQLGTLELVEARTRANIPALFSQLTSFSGN